MPVDNQNHKAKIIATNDRFDDIVEYLESLVDDAADVRNPLGTEQDSREVRIGITTFLQGKIAHLKKLRYPKVNKGSDSSDYI